MRHSMLLGVGTLWSLGSAFVKIGLVFFGGGFLLIPVIHRNIVVQLHWLTQQEFVDGVAISQLTPGPVAVLATFCGFKQAGAAGAVLATAAVMLPAFALMLILSQGYQKVSAMRPVRTVLNGLIPAIVGLLLASALQIGQGTMRGAVDLAVFVVALALMVRWKTNPALLIGLGAALGLALRA